MVVTRVNILAGSAICPTRWAKSASPQTRWAKFKLVDDHKNKFSRE